MLIKAGVFRHGVSAESKQVLLEELDTILLEGEEKRMVAFIERYSS